MLRLKDGIVELYTKVASSIPSDVEDALKQACASETAETGESPKITVLSGIIENVKKAKTSKKPLCHNIGIPIFWVQIPQGLDREMISSDIVEGCRQAVSRLHNQPSDKSEPGTTLGLAEETVDTVNPVIYFEDSDRSSLVIDLLLRNTDCQHSEGLSLLQDSGLVAIQPNNAGGADAERYRNEIRDIILETVKKAKKGVCSPYTIGVGLGTQEDDAALLARKQLLRRLNDSNPIIALQGLEKDVLADLKAQDDVSEPGIETTTLGVKIGGSYSDSSALVVNVTICCWANRHGRLIWG
ncbi:MAG: fumarate hydratase [Nitrospirae bacterium]|nr:fumarate hydratase [Nitrospirota bacterium]